MKIYTDDPGVKYVHTTVSPERTKAPEVAVRLREPLVWVRPLDAVRVWVEVKAPLFVVVIPDAPSEMDVAVEVPRFN